MPAVNSTYVGPDLKGVDTVESDDTPIEFIQPNGASANIEPGTVDIQQGKLLTNGNNIDLGSGGLKNVGNITSGSTWFTFRTNGGSNDRIRFLNDANNNDMVYYEAGNHVYSNLPYKITDGGTDGVGELAFSTHAIEEIAGFIGTTSADGILIPDGGPNGTGQIQLGGTGASNPRIYVSSSGGLIAEDASGNTTTII